MKNFHSEDKIEAGVDEAGRGPGLGRVYTAAVIWPKHLDHPCPLVRDSKTISKNQMKSAYDFVIANAIAYNVDYATEEEIESGILKANILSMHRAIAGLNITPQHLLIDGNYFEDYPDIPATTVIKGDSTYYSIAAASILAKYTRDTYIDDLCNDYPELDTRYGIRSNKGYLSEGHTIGLNTHGYCQFHRRTWKTFQNLPFNPIMKKEKIKPVIKKKV